MEIDTEKGHDAPQEAGNEPGMTLPAKKDEAQADENQPVQVRAVSFTEELVRARLIKTQAMHLVRNLMEEARLGKIIELERVQPVVQDIVDSITRNSSALLALLQIRNKDDYAFLRSVGV